ncbi:MAG TPA: hypothetical protein VFB32_12240 [Rudaea sp.]|nr:hypothetical protein [Rudaea sp.]
MKRISQAAIAAIALTLAGSAFARYGEGPYYFDSARVVRVDRIIEPGSEPVSREECWQEPSDASGTTRESQVFERTHVDNDGVVRNDIVQVRSEEPQYVQKCRIRTEYADASKVLGYDVVFRYHGEDFHDRMNHDPGTQVRVRVQDGYVQLAE